MELLDHGTDHLADLVVKEALSTQVEVDEFERVRILSICHGEVFRVDVHKLASTQLNHVSLGCLLIWLKVLGIVVVLLGAFESFAEHLVHELSTLLRQSVTIHLLNKLRISKQM